MRHGCIEKDLVRTLACESQQRGEMFNLGCEEYTVEKGERIAQLVIGRYEGIQSEEGELGDSARGAGGFGSSGR